MATPDEPMLAWWYGLEAAERERIASHFPSGAAEGVAELAELIQRFQPMSDTEAQTRALAALLRHVDAPALAVTTSHQTQPREGIQPVALSAHDPESPP